MVRLAGGTVGAIRGEHVVAAARIGDGEALETLTEFSRWLALGLVNLTEIFDPALIVLGGGLVVTSDMWLDQTRKEVVAQSRRATLHDESNIVEAALGRRAAAIGAALVGRGVQGAL
jgi:glucokinase